MTKIEDEITIRTLSPYQFEETQYEFGLFGRCRKKLSDAEYKAICTKAIESLGLKEQNISQKHRELLQTYIEVTHLSAWWFNNRVNRLFKVRWWWFWISSALFIAILLCALALPQFIDINSPTQSASLIGTQVTLLLSGIILIFRAINSWVGSYSNIAAYWKGRSDLLDIIYSLETTWGSNKKDSEKLEGTEFSREFRIEVEEKIKEARSKTKEAMKKVIESMQAPTLSIDDFVTAQSTAATIFSNTFKSNLDARVATEEAKKVERDEIEKAEKLQIEIDHLSAQIAKEEDVARELRSKIDELSQNLNSANPSANDDIMIDKYTKELSEVHSLIAKWKSELKEKEKELAQAGG